MKKPINCLKKSKFFQIFYFVFFKIKKTACKNFRKPLLAGIKLTNNCNLKCLHCPFWRTNEKKSLKWEEIKSVLKKLYDDGVKITILEGGEPLLWKDPIENKNIHDVIDLAKKYFFSTAITTNGTLNFSDIRSDIIFISLDGLEATHNSIRGDVFNIIIDNIRKNNKSKKIIVNITISKINLGDVAPLIKFLQGMVFGITIQFFYPYKGVENLSLGFDEKKEIINNIIRLKKEGYKILDSVSALKKMIKNNWRCEDYLVASVDPDGKINYGCYLKNRVKNISCENCGFLAHCEISLSFQLDPDALICAKNIFWNKVSSPNQEEVF